MKHLWWEQAKDFTSAFLFTSLLNGKTYGLFKYFVFDMTWLLFLFVPMIFPLSSLGFRILKFQMIIFASYGGILCWVACLPSSMEVLQNMEK